MPRPRRPRPRRRRSVGVVVGTRPSARLDDRSRGVHPGSGRTRRLAHVRQPPASAQSVAQQGVAQQGAPLSVAQQTDPAKEQFERGKEVLSLLLGVFGTIVGYYFGSTNSSAATELRVSQPRVTLTGGDTAKTILVQCTVGGGSAPYLFGIAVGDKAAEPIAPVAEDGWIVQEVPVPGASTGPVVIRVVAQDASGKRIERRAVAVLGGKVDSTPVVA